MRSHSREKKIIRRENRDWCVYTDLGLSCFFYCVSSDASGRPKNARNCIQKITPQALDKRLKERMREILKELEMARKRKGERKRWKEREKEKDDSELKASYEVQSRHHSPLQQAFGLFP